MKVLHITNCYPFDGDPDYGIFVKRQVESLRSKLDLQDVVFLNARKNGMSSYFNVQPFKASEYDVVHCHHLFSFLAVWWRLRGGRAVVVLSLLNEFHNEIKLPLPKVVLGFICKLFCYYPRVLIYKASLPGTHSNNIVYLPNGVDTDFFRPLSSCLNEGSGRKKIIFVSSKNPYRKQKRLDVFRRVCEILEAKHGVDVDPVIASGESADDYLRLLQEADLHLLCSDYEGSPNSVKEAMSVNLPVVSTDVGNVREMFGVCPFYRVSDARSPEVLAELCVEVLRLDRSKCDGRTLLGEAGLTIDAVADKLMKLYLKECS